MILAVSCVGAGKAGKRGHLGIWSHCKCVQVQGGHEGPGHTCGSGMVVTDDGEVGLGWNLTLSPPSFGAVGKWLNLSVPFSWSPWESVPVSREGLARWELPPAQNIQCRGAGIGWSGPPDGDAASPGS